MMARWSLILSATALLYLPAIAQSNRDPTMTHKEKADLLCAARIDVISDAGGIEVLREADHPVQIKLNLSEVDRRGASLSEGSVDGEAAKEFYTNSYFEELGKVLGTYAQDAILTVEDIESDLADCLGETAD